MILLLGAGPDDPAVDSFDGYLARRSIPHAVCRDPGGLAFAVRVEADGRARVRLRLPGHDGTLRGEEVAVYVRDPWTLVPPGPDDPDARFAADEYRAALWSLCAFLPNVVNRPGRQAWPDAPELRRLLVPSSVLREYWTTDPRKLLDGWARSPAAELHVEDLLTHERRVVTEPGGLGAGGAGGPGTPHLRALFAPSSAYVVALCVGRRTFTVLNEPGVDVDAEPYRRLLRDLAAVLRGEGIRFFAVALVADERHRLSVSRVLPVPPFPWYRDVSDAVHEQLCAELGHGPETGTEGVR